MNEYRYCDFWRRLGALFIDSVLLSFISFIIGFFEDYLAPIKGQGIVSTEFTYFLDKVLIIFSLLATSLFNFSKMQVTPGKYFLKMKIITSDGRKIGLLRALVRILISSFIAVATVFLSLILLVSYYVFK